MFIFTFIVKKKGLFKNFSFWTVSLILIATFEASPNCTRSVKRKMPDEDLLFDLAELFKIFGDSTRIKILFSLLVSASPVNDIAENLKMTQSAISHQLRILKANKLVKYNRDGKSLIYSLDDEHVEKILNMGMAHLCEKI